MQEVCLRKCHSVQSCLVCTRNEQSISIKAICDLLALPPHYYRVRVGLRFSSHCHLEMTEKQFSHHVKICYLDQIRGKVKISSFCKPKISAQVNQTVIYIAPKLSVLYYTHKFLQATVYLSLHGIINVKLSEVCFKMFSSYLIS